MVLKIGRKRITVTDLAEASRTYQAHRDASGLGASDFPEGVVTDGHAQVARVSYNGRVWTPEPWHPGAAPIMEAR